MILVTVAPALNQSITSSINQSDFLKQQSYFKVNSYKVQPVKQLVKYEAV